jgi:hypothetical protein
VGEVVLAFSLIVAALAVRVHAASFQLWLDEIWALEASRSVGSLADLFRAEVLDGHFSLYTVWLGAFTAATPEEVLRLPSLVGGAVQLIGTWFLARRWWVGARSLLCFSRIDTIVLRRWRRRGFSAQSLCVAPYFISPLCLFTSCLR